MPVPDQNPTSCALGAIPYAHLLLNLSASGFGLGSSSVMSMCGNWGKTLHIGLAQPVILMNSVQVTEVTLCWQMLVMLMHLHPGWVSSMGVKLCKQQKPWT